MILYNFQLKNGISKTKKTITSLLMIGILAIGGLEIVLPRGTEAGFLVETSNLLTNTSITQENTILQTNILNSSDVKKKVKMVVTAYSSTVEQTDSTPFITASGSWVADGIVANNLFPFGTKIRIPSLYGDKIFVVGDRMNKKKGNYHLDIWFENTAEAKNFGAEIAYIEVLRD